MAKLTRRDAIGAMAMTAASYSRILGANERLRMGYIGLGNRGDQVHDAFLEHGDATTAAVCDLREDYMGFASEKAARKGHAAPKRFDDYRKLIEDKDIDAVMIATPDHWHALMFVAACNAGKDVYVEKPMSLTVVEGRKMVETAATHQARGAGGDSPSLGGVPSRSCRVVARARLREDQRCARISRTQRMAERDRQTGRRSYAGRHDGKDVGRVARSGTQGSLQFESDFLSLPLVLRLFGRAAH
jgi:hypothetical protein